MFSNALLEDTIVAISTPPGTGGIAVIRCSGIQSFSILQQVFFRKNQSFFDVSKAIPRRLYYGIISEGDNVIDDVLMSIFKYPHSYTGEDMVEIYCHGSIYVQKKIVQLFIDKGARLANAGEFTTRAYLNGKMNLAEAEAIGDIIHAETESAHRLAIEQLRGGYIALIHQLRESILNFCSLLELELDFSEEDVEFANRKQLSELLNTVIDKISELTHSFQLGNAIKSGVPVSIIGKPNAGKSTLLNALLNEEKAIVSDIPGTTRDLIEDSLIIHGIQFRIIDTAGIREAKDEIEKIGIERAKQSIQKSMIVIILSDVNDNWQDVEKQVELVRNTNQDAFIMKVFNKADTLEKIPETKDNVIFISAKNKWNIDALKNKLYEAVVQKGYKTNQTLVSNIRHYNELKQAKYFLEKAKENLNQHVSTELIAEDLRFAIQHLSNITGKITSEDVLRNIFSKFCIGK
ncbi:MAG: tRNA uridine-5-carboxymethylaminomethyl(34) synthesis GTPase MnmE [Bacteroidia bacterium]|nr:tRNA uridine-5-carboxymethylaminomethyl(34) synthesis GTPase MnmE [Bacteroidia bacterium]